MSEWRTKAQFLAMMDTTWVSLARRPEGLRGGADIKPLPPRLWEELRQQLQAEYRRATGEPMATLHVEHSSETTTLTP